MRGFCPTAVNPFTKVHQPQGNTKNNLLTFLEPFLRGKGPVACACMGGFCIRTHCTKKTDLHKFTRCKNMVRKSANSMEIKSKGGKYRILHASLHRVVKLRANALFTSFALYLTVVCTFFAANLYCVNWVLEIFIFFSFNSKFAMICGGSQESEVSPIS